MVCFVTLLYFTTATIISHQAAVPGLVWLSCTSRGFMRVDKGVSTDWATKDSRFLFFFFDWRAFNFFHWVQNMGRFVDKPVPGVPMCASTPVPSLTWHSAADRPATAFKALHTHVQVPAFGI